MGAGLGSAFQSPFPIWEGPRVPQLAALHLSSKKTKAGVLLCALPGQEQRAGRFSLSVPLPDRCS